MARGVVLSSERRTFIQRETGVCVIQLIDAACKNNNAYYNYEQFIGESLIFYSNRTEIRQIYQVMTDSGKIVQLTDAKSGVAGSAVAAALGVVYYAQKDSVRVLDVETLDEETVANRLPGCGPLLLQDLSSCGRYLVLSCRPE